MQRKGPRPWRDLTGGFSEWKQHKGPAQQLKNGKETVAVEDLVTWFESHCEDLIGSGAAASHLVPGSVKI